MGEREIQDTGGPVQGSGGAAENRLKHPGRVDMLPPVTEALKVQKAQQAARRIKAGEGAPERGEDYVFTGRNGGLLNGNYLRDRAW